MQPEQPERATLEPDERAAIRAFLQRCEVRLSTLHRTATALLSGAGLLVVLPVVARDSITGTTRALLVGAREPHDVLLLVGVAAMLFLPAVALWLVFRDLTRFYFHANHVGHENASTTFTLRFTLTSLRLPCDELGPAGQAALDAARTAPEAVELLVASNDAARRRVDRQLAAHDAGRGRRIENDLDRAEGLFELAAARTRPLVEEVAKVEHGMARHTLRLQGIVLRYVKALLSLLVTAAAVYAGDAAVAGALDAGVGPSEAVVLAGVLLLWSPAVVVAVTSPIRWIEQLARSESAAETAVGHDPEFTFVERISLRIAAVAWCSSAMAMVFALTSAGGVGSDTRGFGLAVLAVSLAVVGFGASTGRYRGLLRIG